MTETRAQAQAREAATRDAEESSNAWIVKALVEQDSRIAENYAEMFAVIRMMAEKVDNLVAVNPQMSYSSSPPTIEKADYNCFPTEVEQFFQLDFTPYEMKVSYKLLLKERFEDALDDPIAELKILQETGGIKEYNEKFELIRLRLRLPEDYLVRAYLAGLRTDTQMHIRMFQPQTIRQCWMLGKLYEQAHPRKGSGMTSNGWQSNKWQTGGNVQPKAGVANNSDWVQKTGNFESTYRPKDNTMQPRKFLSTEEMNKRRSQGLCFFCDEKYSPEHFLTHKKKQLYMMDADEVEEKTDELCVEEDEGPDMVQDRAQVSVSAVEGTNDFWTMRVRGYYGKQSVVMLLDSGSTHNFMDLGTLARLKIPSTQPCLTKVFVSDGQKVGVSGKMEKFNWSFRDTSFEADMMVIPLRGCDIVLGVQWLKPLGTITWNFDTLEMSFKWGLKNVHLRGIKQGFVREVKATKLNKMKEKDVQLSMICVEQVPEESEVMLCSVEMQTGKEEEHPKFAELIEGFADIFEEPTALPPFRANHNHKIPLMEGSNPINQRPYRYALHQKNEIDKLVKDMLVGGSIQASNNPYASPVVLVKKKDGSWRLCVDYRGLNGMTVKDRFPIPLIDDLMDELGGSVIFSKIDLRAGYHQVRMDPADIYKTTFKTHSGHYKYLVMPFGLTNAPATFQSLMNEVFRAFLRKFVLIFFDDILIYSSTLENHLLHVEEVFKVM
ncbi:PREDICTED: uncharacterized protein LOC104783713 [Camelina sativa]|uniref:Uncharacterized protein LOC104783713 n=1 Tax=Camelina sativa TaxID=90675 RepID=A0ABM0YWY6_CAMSA|nr:PREDICTED: uncharacterized protein LOC104783713 [Camelina sativa]